MKCIIAGGRDYIPTAGDKETIIQIINHYKITAIVSGHSGTSDLFGEKLAGELKLKVKLFPADWNKYGKKAGPLRNRQMAEYTDYAILFPGGKGTMSMKNEMKIHNKRILYDFGDE
jgi:hypothetical protein